MIRIDNAPETLGRLARRFESNGVLPRIWAHDPTVWGNTSDEVVNRLDWLHLPFSMQRHLSDIETFAQAVVSEGIEHILLLGMGGSSLAPETFFRTYGRQAGHPELMVLDSTHPQAIQDAQQRLNLERTLVIVATKSGGTTETLSLFRYFFARISEFVGPSRAGRQFVAITDPGSRLVEIASTRGFRELFVSNPNIGGRYSAFSHFGLVPAALCGIPISDILASVRPLASDSALKLRVESNVGAQLGLLLGAAALEERNKLTFVLSETIESFGTWVEQLIAESTGKHGLGIVPIVGEVLGDPCTYRTDRVFAVVGAPGLSIKRKLEALRKAGHPIITLAKLDAQALPQLMYLWEFATAIAGHVLSINPFDQPNVESAKRLSRAFIEEHRRTGKLPASDAVPLSSEGLLQFIDEVPSGYYGIQAYLPPSESLNHALGVLRHRLRTRTRTCTTLGYGPRFLHSTGQLHKGDSGEGAFAQLVSERMPELLIPEEDDSGGMPLSFGALIAAQAAGDRQALQQAGRRVATFVVSSARQLLEAANTI